MKLPSLVVKDVRLDNCIVQGGMGVGVSLHSLAGAVAKEGGLGIISSAGLRSVVSSRDGKNVDTYTAVRSELEKTRSLAGKGAIGINVMCAIVKDYDDTIRASIDAGADVISSGAGLPLGLPGIKPPGRTALIPIVSSARALEIIIKRWERQHYRPDAVVLEGPLAGGHLGFTKREQIDDPDFALEKLLLPVLDMAHKYGSFPVIVAGGIYTHEDIIRFLRMGASGVQLGTRFLVTEESAATEAYKQAVVLAGKDDIMVVSYPDKLPASPCGLPFRVLTSSPMYRTRREAKCDKGYVLLPGRDGKLSCQAMPTSPNNQSFLCICNGLLSSAGHAPTEPPLYTVGTNAHRIDKVLPTAELMRELRGE
jgi:nitronate monooxygenase